MCVWQRVFGIIQWNQSKNWEICKKNQLNFDSGFWMTWIVSVCEDWELQWSWCDRDGRAWGDRRLSGEAESMYMKCWNVLWCNSISEICCFNWMMLWSSFSEHELNLIKFPLKKTLSSCPFSFQERHRRPGNYFEYSSPAMFLCGIGNDKVYFSSYLHVHISKISAMPTSQ